MSLIVTPATLRAWRLEAADNGEAPLARFLETLANELEASATGHADVWTAPFRAHHGR